MEEPTPIRDLLHSVDELSLFAAIAVFSLVAFTAGQQFEIMWLSAGASVSSLMFGGVAIGGYLWRRFKHWRYPSYYDTEVDGE